MKTSPANHARLQDIFFLWRPFLPDPDDDMILELAFASEAAKGRRKDFDRFLSAVPDREPEEADRMGEQ